MNSSTRYLHLHFIWCDVQIICENRSVLSEVIPHVRFPLMSVADFSSVVQTSGVVPGMRLSIAISAQLFSFIFTVLSICRVAADDVLKLFTYIAQRASSVISNLFIVWIL
jgi:hypothetical protein